MRRFTRRRCVWKRSSDIIDIAPDRQRRVSCARRWREARLSLLASAGTRLRRRLALTLRAWQSYKSGAKTRGQLSRNSRGLALFKETHDAISRLRRHARPVVGAAPRRSARVARSRAAAAGTPGRWASYFTRLTDLTIRGEESRWARVAQEMLDTGDWIVPRQQGEPFPDRPPLNSWAMIAASQLTGELNLAAIRLPAVTGHAADDAGHLSVRPQLSVAASAPWPRRPRIPRWPRCCNWARGRKRLAVDAVRCRRRCSAGTMAMPVAAIARLAWIGGYALAALAGTGQRSAGTGLFRGDHDGLSGAAPRLAILVQPLASGRTGRVRALSSAPGNCRSTGSSMPTSAQAIWSEGGEMSRAVRLRERLARSARSLGVVSRSKCLACMMPWSFMLLAVCQRAGFARGSADAGRWSSSC